MGSLTATTPKPLLQLRGRPIIEHVLLGLRAAGVGGAIVVTGYRGEQIERHLGTGSDLGMRLRFRTQRQPQGTARALLLVRDLLNGEPFLLSWGDVVVDPDEYRRLLKAFDARPCEALLAINRVDDPWRGAAVYVDEDLRVTRLVEKPPKGTSHTRWNNAGIFAFTPQILGYAERLQPSSRSEYELPQAIAAMVEDGVVVRAHPLHGFWSDLGTPEDLAAAERTYRPSYDAPYGASGSLT
jgi:NDP-sugar pyrophosphorylase family protein